VLHLDVHQGENASQVSVNEEARGLPTTQRAVVNAVLESGLHLETRAGYRHVAMDNRYQCPELAVLLRERTRLYSTETCRKKRKGWNGTLLNMAKKEEATKAEASKGLVGGPRNEAKFAHDKQNGIVACQWRDSKVVNCVSSIPDTSIGQVKRQRGAVASFCECPNMLIKHQQTMFGVDKGDQMRLHGGGFARKAHFKKWCKRAFMAALDMMLLNGLIAWNLSSQDPLLHRSEFTRYDFYTWVAESMLHFVDPARFHKREPMSPELVRDTAARRQEQPLHKPGPTARRSWCQVCRLEANVSECKDIKALSGKNCVSCLNPNCRIIAHNFVPNPLKVHQLMGVGQTCFDLAHGAVGLATWEPDSRGLKTVPYKVKTSHPVVQSLRQHYGLNAKKQRTKSNSVGNSTIDSNN